MIRKIPEILRILDGFLPVLNPAFFVCVMMNDFKKYFVFKPWLVPWEIWLWLALTLAAGILLCQKRTVLPGLGIALLIDPLLLLIEGIRYGSTLFQFHALQFLFYAVYAVLYLILHRKRGNA